MELSESMLVLADKGQYNHNIYFIVSYSAENVKNYIKPILFGVSLLNHVHKNQ